MSLRYTLPVVQRWVASRPMFLAFSPEMLGEWIRRANRPPPSSGGGAASASASEAALAADWQLKPFVRSSSSRRVSRISQADDLDEEYDIVTRQSKALDTLYR